MVGVWVDCIVIRGKNLETTRLQLADVVLQMFAVLGFGIVHRKFKFSVVQGCVWDQVLKGCWTPVCLNFDYSIMMSICHQYKKRYIYKEVKTYLKEITNKKNLKEDIENEKHCKVYWVLQKLSVWFLIFLILTILYNWYRIVI